MRTLCSTLVAVSVLALGAGAADARPSDDTQSAKEHYKRGTTLYDLGKYDEAIVEFQQAYELKDDPVLLYNIAQSFRLANKYQDALRFYKTYLRKSPRAPNRDEVETKIADMDNLIQQQAKVAAMPSADVVPPKGDRPADIGARPARSERAVAASSRTPAQETPAPVETPQPIEQPVEQPVEKPVEQPVAAETAPDKDEKPPLVGETKPETKPETPAEGGEPSAPKPGRTLVIAGVVVAIAGVAIAAAGIGLGAVASSDSKKQEQAAMFDPALDSQGRSFGTLGPVLAAAGGAVALTGIIVAAIGATRKPAEQPKVSLLPSVGRDGAGAALQMHF